jgi:UMF1 family MFS transporter
MTPAGASPASRRAVIAWILFDPAAQPVFTLITTFVFAPYFAGRLASTPAEGQALWGFATAGAGVAIAVLSPILGAIADAAGRRKPWIAAFSVVLVAGCVLLWFTPPGRPASIPFALAGFILATLGVEFATVFNNAMMPDLVPAERLGRLSGTGWAVGYVGGLLSLVVMLSFALANPATDRTIAGLAPVFGLDPQSGGGDRLAGPLSALWYVVLVLPLFLFVPDRARRAAIGDAVRGGLAELVQSLRASGMIGQAPVPRRAECRRARRTPGACSSRRAGLRSRPSPRRRGAARRTRSASRSGRRGRRTG